MVTPLATRGWLMDLQSANYISDRPYERGTNDEERERRIVSERER